LVVRWTRAVIRCSRPSAVAMLAALSQLVYFEKVPEGN